MASLLDAERHVAASVLLRKATPSAVDGWQRHPAVLRTGDRCSDTASHVMQVSLTAIVLSTGPLVLHLRTPLANAATPTGRAGCNPFIHCFPARLRTRRV